jgi:hypothetical protein
MPTRAPLVPLLLLVLLAACAPVGSRELHEVVVLGPDGSTRLGYAYGSADALPLPDGDVALGPVVGDAAREAPFAVAGARSVDGAPLLQRELDATVEAPLTVARIPLTTDLRVTTAREVPRAYYFDGARWFELPRDLAAGVDRTVVPRPVAAPLRGAGALTPAEADAVAAGLGRDGAPRVVAVLAEAAELPEAASPRPPDGLDEYRHTALWVQRRLPTDEDAYRPEPRRSLFEVVATGDQGADPGRDRFVLIDDEDALRSFWNAVHAGALDPPPRPEARFGRETLLGVRLAQRPSGGYRIEVERVVREDDQVFVDVRLVEPAEGAPVTTALTSPWALLRVLGVDASVAWFRDPEDGALFAVARADDAGPF